jgi:hypothetical protein
MRRDDNILDYLFLDFEVPPTFNNGCEILPKCFVKNITIWLCFNVLNALIYNITYPEL